MLGLRSLIARRRSGAADDTVRETGRVTGDSPAGAPDGTPTPDPRAATLSEADALLRQLEWTVSRRLDGILQGDYRSLFRGFGLDLADLREYQAHDDVRHIDWNVTARMQSPYVREYQEDREIAAWFLVDLSGSQDLGSGRRAKRLLATQFVGVMARLLTRRGNRVGAIVYDGALDVPIPAQGGRRQVLRVLDRLLRSAPRRLPEGTSLGPLLARALRMIPRRSVVFVVSDFISRPGWDIGMALLARRHETAAVRVFDPVEADLPDLGLVLLEDAETGEQLFVDSRDPGFRRRFAALASQREQTLRAALNQAGVDCLELSTQADLAESLLHFASLRKRRSQRAGASTHSRMTR